MPVHESRASRCGRRARCATASSGGLHDSPSGDDGFDAVANDQHVAREQRRPGAIEDQTASKMDRKFGVVVHREAMLRGSSSALDSVGSADRITWS